jgi:hypothetical protein
MVGLKIHNSMEAITNLDQPSDLVMNIFYSILFLTKSDMFKIEIAL